MMFALGVVNENGMGQERRQQRDETEYLYIYKLYSFTSELVSGL